MGIFNGDAKMCLAVIAWHVHPDYPLILVANRDEFYTRPTRSAAWWGQPVSLLAGRDEKAGGTWLGVNRHGRFALLTNVRASIERNPNALSRGSLVVAALQSCQPVSLWLAHETESGSTYNGFNLLVGEASRNGELLYYSNRLGQPPKLLAPGIYGLSNAFLDTPWPKLTRAVVRFSCQVASYMDQSALLELLADHELARDQDLPSTNVPLEWERALSAIKVRTNDYGTRSTTLITVRRDGLVSFIERQFNIADPDCYRVHQYDFVINAKVPSNS